MPETIVITDTSILINFLVLDRADLLARLPGDWPLVGGAITLEAISYGAATGLALALVIAAFATFQRALATRDLVRLIPRAFGTLALAVAVALTYAPSARREVAA